MLELLFCVDEQLRITSCCDRFGELTGATCAALPGMQYTQVLPHLVYRGRDALEQVLRTGEGLQLEQVRLGYQLPIPVAELVLKPLEEAGARKGVRVFARTLKEGPGARLSRPLRRSEELEKLTIMLSHGVRNPLNAIKGAVTYLQSRFSHEPELEEFTGIMTEEIARLERFVGGFLATSCVDQAAVALDINALLKKISVYTALQARAAGVDLDLHCGSVKPLRVSPFQIEQAILNLLNNAIAVLPQGGRIRLSSGLCQKQGRSWVVLQVADDGPGMPQAKIEALSDPASEPERGRERGFGLYITREVVQSYGGMMEIDSTAGEGTRVRLLLPADEDATP